MLYYLYFLYRLLNMTIALRLALRCYHTYIQLYARDLKPSNIFIGEDGHLIVGDFGVATVVEDMRVRARTVVG